MSARSEGEAGGCHLGMRRSRGIGSTGLRLCHPQNHPGGAGTCHSRFCTPPREKGVFAVLQQGFSAVSALEDTGAGAESCPSPDGASAGQSPPGAGTALHQPRLSHPCGISPFGQHQWLCRSCEGHDSLPPSSRASPLLSGEPWSPWVTSTAGGTGPCRQHPGTSGQCNARSCSISLKTAQKPSSGSHCPDLDHRISLAHPV